MVPLFYTVDMQHKCFFYNDANSSWERWDDDTLTDSPIPPGKYYFQRVRFDKGLLLLNYPENCYVHLQIRPLERHYAFKRFFRARRSFWPDREGIVFGETASDDRLFLLYRSPPVIWPLKLLSFWKLAALLDKKRTTGSNNFNEVVQQRAIYPTILEIPDTSDLFSFPAFVTRLFTQ
ncbi:hypothetical protein GPALN_015597 [Globodera pallida]|nr:hypothetical protein GPALN_015597 [Globodera pallida]